MAISRSRSLRNFAVLGLSGSQNHVTTERAIVGSPCSAVSPHTIKQSGIIHDITYLRSKTKSAKYEYSPSPGRFHTPMRPRTHLQELRQTRIYQCEDQVVLEDRSRKGRGVWQVRTLLQGWRAGIDKPSAPPSWSLRLGRMILRPKRRQRRPPRYGVGIFSSPFGSIGRGCLARVISVRLFMC